MQLNPLALAMIVPTGLCFALTFYAWKWRRVPGSILLGFLSLAFIFYAFGNGLKLASVNIVMLLYAFRFEYIGFVTIPVLWFLIAFQFSGRHEWVNRRNLILIFALPAASLILNYSNDLHHLFFRSASLFANGQLRLLTTIPGIWYWVFAAYSAIAFVVGSLLLLLKLPNSKGIQRSQVVFLLISILGASIAYGFSLLNLHPANPSAWLPFVFMVSLLAAAWGVFHYQLVPMVQMGQDMLVQKMKDGIVLIDNQMMISEMNPAAIQILNLRDEYGSGHTLDEVFQGMPQVIAFCRSSSALPFEMEMNGVYIKFSLSPILNRAQYQEGHLLLMENLTRLKRTEDDLHLAKIKTENLKKDVQQSFQNLEALNELSQTLKSSHDMEWILQNSIKLANELLNSAICCLYLETPNGLTYSYGHPIEVFEKNSDISPLDFSLEMIHQHAVDAFQRGVILQANGKEIIAPRNTEPSAIYVPLKSAEKKEGVLIFVAFPMSSFTRKDTLLAEMIAHQLAMVIENTRLSHKVETLTQTDNLTGLYSRKHFYYLAEHEFNFSTRYRRLLSLVILDVDHLADVHTKFGRAGGDAVMQKTAQCIQASLRAVDLVARYNEEKMILLLPATAVDEACHVAERIRQQVEMLEIQTEKGLVHVTASLGLTCMDLEKDQSIDDLIRRADTALYDAKNKGYNRFSKSRSD